MTTLIIDADYLAYRYAYANESSVDWGDGVVSHEADLTAAENEINTLITRWQEGFYADVVLALSDPEHNWRKDVLPTYKDHRDESRRPAMWQAVRDFLQETWKCYLKPTLEGDDVCGILATSKTIIPGKKIVVGVDKDLLQVPSRLFNPVKGTRHIIKEEQADHFHMMQTLTGDPSDGYKGCPQVGPKRAEAVLGVCAGMTKCWWPVVVQTYEKAGLTEEDALVQARVARICRNTDYNFKKKEVKLWLPSS